MSQAVFSQFQAINGRLIESRKAVQERDRILSLMATLDQQLVETRAELAQQNRILQSEQNDVQRLESLTVTAVFNRLFGDYEEKLEREVAEYLQAKVAVESCLIRLNSLQVHLQDMDTFLVALADCDEAYAQAVAEQRQFLVQQGLVHPKKLSVLAEQIALQKAFIREIDEARQVGGAVLEQFDDLTTLIAGDKLIATKILLDRMGDATFGIGRVVLRATKLQPELDHFQTELEDIDAPFSPPPDLEVPRYNDVMPSEEINKTHQTYYYQMARSYNTFHHNVTIHRWIRHLLAVKERLKDKIEQLHQIKEAAVGKQQFLEDKQSQLFERLWQEKNFGQNS